MRAGKTAVQERMKFNLQTYLKKIFDQVKQSSDVYHLSVNEDLSSLERVLTQNIRCMCDRIPKFLDEGHREVSHTRKVNPRRQQHIGMGGWYNEKLNSFNSNLVSYAKLVSFA